MDEKLDAIVDPHAPLPLSNAWRQHRGEVDPIRIDPFVNARGRLNPAATDGAA
jgi:hypothetical protein